MKTDLVVLGARVNMASRLRRRVLVVVAYVLIGISIVGEWFVARRLPDFCALYGVFICLFGTSFLNNYLGGPAGFGRGLIRPFGGNETLRDYGYDIEGRPIPKFLRDKYLNDEWDLRRRNEAHWRAYRWIYLFIGISWATVSMKVSAAGMTKDFWFAKYASSYAFDLLIWCLLTALICVHLTLPQAILLWTEPDIEEP